MIEIKDNLERCFICDELTDRAREGEDSIYLTNTTSLNEEGPFCEDCCNECLKSGAHME